MKALMGMVIPHAAQRYETVGDYFTDKNGCEQFRVSAMKDERYEDLVMLHEIVERMLCHHWKIPNEAIDTFDNNYEAKRKVGDLSEPGDHADAPYYHAHQIATAVERMIAAVLWVDWVDYEKTVQELSK